MNKSIDNSCQRFFIQNEIHVIFCELHYFNIEIFWENHIGFSEKGFLSSWMAFDKEILEREIFLK